MHQNPTRVVPCSNRIVNTHGQDAAFLLTIGSFLLTSELFCLQLCLGAFSLTVRAVFLTVQAFLLTIELLCLQLSFFAYSGKVCIRSPSTDCKQRSSTVSKEAPTVSRKLPPIATQRLQNWSRQVWCERCASRTSQPSKRMRLRSTPTGAGADPWNPNLDKAMKNKQHYKTWCFVGTIHLLTCHLAL